jgi:flagellar biosynthesis protein FlhA
MRTIIETLAEHAPKSQDPVELTALVRVALGRAIVQQIFPAGQELQVMALEPGLERVLTQALAGAGADGASIEPGLADTLLGEAAAAAKRQEDLGLPPVLLVPSGLRWLLSRFLRRAWTNLKVLANSEIPESKTIKVTAIIGAKA